MISNIAENNLSWLDKLLPPKIKSSIRTSRLGVPEGTWCKCAGCEEVLFRVEFEKNQCVCPKCYHHGRINARDRLKYLLDQNTLVEIGAQLRPKDPLKFKDVKRYVDRIKDAERYETEALIAFEGKIYGRNLVVVCFEFAYMGGSMGSVVGERFMRSVHRSVELCAPFVCVTASGGARMQESVFSLMQMAKTTAAITLLNKNRLPFITILTDPTMGGVSASFAFLGDIVIAEPKALIGFAGPRVIQQTVRETLPSGFQRSEFLLEKGAIDMIADRRSHREVLNKILRMLMMQPQFDSEE